MIGVRDTGVVRGKKAYMTLFFPSVLRYSRNKENVIL